MTSSNDTTPTPQPQRQKIAAIACGVLEWNLQRVIERLDTPYEYITRVLPAQLHNNPRNLRELLQQHIDELENTPGLIGICLLFGLCGRGTVNLETRSLPVIIPRAQDCIGIYLGSHERYLAEFKSHPGTRYMSRGWYDKTVKDVDASTEDFMTLREKSLYKTSYDQLKEQFGDENAAFISHFRESWKRNYTRAGYIRFEGETDNAPGLEITRATADTLDWEFRELTGDESLIEAMLSGKWQHPELVIVPPNSKTVAAPGNAVIGYTTQLDMAEIVRQYAERAADTPREKRTGLGLGIDTGGTYTDAVIYDFDSGKIADFAKSPTTHDDLVVGIRGALAKLSENKLKKINRASISTTLATNAFVEKKGRKVALLLMSPVKIDRNKLNFEFIRSVQGKITIDGEETQPVDIDQIQTVANEAVADGCEAFAVSGFGAVMNPAHEKEVARIAFETTGIHAVCGHELSSELNFIDRATTAAMNAKLIPLIENLLTSVRAALAEVGLPHVKIMVVKGDGSQMLDRVAETVPVETIMSGPAASVVGAAFLSGSRDAVVADMGGTTLDVAVLRDGLPDLSDSGAVIGDFQTCVRAMRIHTTGLGGDSEIDLSQWPKIRIGPRRIEPISRLPMRHPQVINQLDEIFQSIVPREQQALEFFEILPGAATKSQSPMTAALADGPLAAMILAEKLDRPGPAFLKWRENEDRGLIRRYGLTLTDVLHANGDVQLHDPEAAGRLLDAWGILLDTDRSVIIDAIYQEFRKRVSIEIIGALLHGEAPWQTRHPDTFPDWLAQHLANTENPQEKAVFKFSSDHALLPVGAPVAALFPQMKNVLEMPLEISEYAPVANAVGAIAGDVLLKEIGAIRLTEDNALLCTWRGGNKRATSIKEALELTDNALRLLLEQQARENEVPFDMPLVHIIPHEATTKEGKVLLGVTMEAELRR
jgi:N-methylhydantoinase A/oxoprolinase/acetone carboxylase beta subunit